VVGHQTTFLSVSAPPVVRLETTLSPLDFILADELRQPFSRFVWDALSLLPLVATGTHVLAALSTIAVLKERSGLAGPDRWPSSWVAITIGTVLATSTCCSVAAGQYFLALRRFRISMVECIGQSSQSRKTAFPTPMPPQASRWEVFISSKTTEPSGGLSKDAAIAEHLYESLISRGARVFFSLRSLRDTGVSAFKASIDEALENSDVLIAVGTTANHLESTWVKYEWDSFFNEILSNNKPSGRIFVCLEGLQPRDLPVSLRQVQTFQYPHDVESLCAFVSNALAERRERDRKLNDAQPGE